MYSIMTLFHYTLVYYFPFFQNDQTEKKMKKVDYEMVDRHSSYAIFNL